MAEQLRMTLSSQGIRTISRAALLGNLVAVGIQYRSSRLVIFLWWLAVISLAILLLSSYWPRTVVPFPTFEKMLTEGSVHSVEINGNEVKFAAKRGRFKSEIAEASGSTLVGNIVAARVPLRFGSSSEGIAATWTLWGLLILLLSTLLVLPINTPRPTLARSPARLASLGDKKVTFKDLAISEEKLAVIKSFRDFLHEAQKFQRLGGRMEKGALIIGPPGSGKTYLMRAIAGEFNVPAFQVSGGEFLQPSPELASERIRDLFEQGKKNAPCVICIDEFEALVRSRTLWPDGLSLYLEAASSQFLSELDGFQTNEGVIVFGATSRPELLDPAVTRSGRLGTVVLLGPPRLEEVEELLRIQLRKIPLGEDVDLSALASEYKSRFPNAQYADFVEIIQQAPIAVGRTAGKFLTQADLLNALSSWESRASASAANAGQNADS
jgi:cell division protease FtsH